MVSDKWANLGYQPQSFCRPQRVVRVRWKRNQKKKKQKKSKNLFYFAVEDFFFLLVLEKICARVKS